MFIITIDPYENGSRPALQFWCDDIIPEGCAACPDEFYDIFYSTTPAGFVNIVVDESTNTVTEMTVNQEAYDAYVAEHPETLPADPEPSAQDDTDSMLVDHEYRITLLELGLV